MLVHLRHNWKAQSNFLKASAAYATSRDALNRQLEHQKRNYEVSLVVTRQEVAMLQKQIIRQSQAHNDELNKQITRLAAFQEKMFRR